VRGGPARVLETLRRADGRSCSGETLSRAEGVSRAQVWKHIETLRALGYDIEACAGEGYRLTRTPDRLYPEEILAGLATRWLAREIHWFDETDSTNRVALELARSGAPHGTTVIAESQTAGRGRLGRSFFSPPHLNLYTSIVLRPTLTTASAPTWILAAATACAETIDGYCAPGEVEIKWPNDVLLRGSKTSGILMELAAEATQVSFLVLGIGINLNVDRGDLPDEFRAHATSLSSHLHAPVDRIAFASSLYLQLEGVLDACAERGFDAVRTRFERFFRMRGREVRVLEIDGGETAGRAVGIDPDGALRIRTAAGREKRVIAGDVTLAKGNA